MCSVHSKEVWQIKMCLPEIKHDRRDLKVKCSVGLQPLFRMEAF